MILVVIYRIVDLQMSLISMSAPCICNTPHFVILQLSRKSKKDLT